ncbi:MFS transporter [Actinomadura madurae]|nr:MFS transporter [Actinomadura madurae]URM99432.1 MFS transporter [Actinomadura madurae]
MSSSEARLLVPALMFIALVVAAVASLGTPLITSVATTFHVSLDSAQWTLTIALLSGAVATPVLGRLGAGPHRRATILATLAIVVVGSALTVLPLPLPFAWLLVGRAAQGVGLGLTALMMGVARDHLPEERSAAAIALISVVSIIGAGVGYPLAALLAEVGGLRAAYGLGLLVTALAFVTAWRSMPAAPEGRSAHVNVGGALVLAGGLLLVLFLAGETSLWSRHLAVAVTLAVAAVLLLCVWTASELRSTTPLVDVRAVRHPAVAGANIAMLVGGSGMYLLLTLITRYAQTPHSAGYGFGLTTFVAGLVLIPFSVLGFVSGRLTPRVRERIDGPPAPGRQRRHRRRRVRPVRGGPVQPGRTARGHGPAGLRRRRLLGRHARRHPGRHAQERDVERHELQLRRPQRRVLPGQRHRRSGPGRRHRHRPPLPGRRRLHHRRADRRRRDGDHDDDQPRPRPPTLTRDQSERSPSRLIEAVRLRRRLRRLADPRRPDGPWGA